jgi:polysaccharide export outer membrane protein
VSGERLVRPDGTVSLGLHGSVSVNGLSPPAAANAIRKHLLATPALKDRDIKPDDVVVCLDVIAFNSKVYYLIIDYVLVNGPDGGTSHRFPLTGNETVLDAIVNVTELAGKLGEAEIAIVRAGDAGLADQRLRVDWKAITESGSAATNYQILPGDRIIVKTKK